MVARWRPIRKPNDVVLVLDWYRVNALGDLSNRIKIVEDALQGAAYDNDSQVRRIIAERFDDADRPRLEVGVIAYPTNVPSLVTEVQVLRAWKTYRGLVDAGETIDVGAIALVLRSAIAPGA